MSIADLATLLKTGYWPFVDQKKADPLKVRISLELRTFYDISTSGSRLSFLGHIQPKNSASRPLLLFKSISSSEQAVEAGGDVAILTSWKWK